MAIECPLLRFILRHGPQGWQEALLARSRDGSSYLWNSGRFWRECGNLHDGEGQDIAYPNREPSPSVRDVALRDRATRAEPAWGVG